MYRSYQEYGGSRRLLQGYRLGDFDCGIADYNDFLCSDAPYYIEQNVTQIKLLINKENADVIAYMVLCSDSFILSDKEKALVGLEIPINTLPSLKIGKLAVSQRYTGKLYGSFMLFLAWVTRNSLTSLGLDAGF